jgi:hypothetical protein
MYKLLGEVTLKSGEKVEAGVALAPDPAWQERIEALLAHKPLLWKWQIAELLAGQDGIETRFHVLHRSGAPFSHILTVELDGVGILGHVWTKPEDRGQAAASQLMCSLLGSFHDRGGKALFLDTGFESPAYHIYRKCGFESVEPGSGVMAYFTASQPEFEAGHFAAGESAIEPLGWAHYATASALFTAGFSGTVRNASLGLWGRTLTEAPLLRALHRDKSKSGGGPSQAFVLRKTDNGAVLGLATWAWDATWPKVCVVDVYCHPDFWDRAGVLLGQLTLPDSIRIVAYADAGHDAKQEVLMAAGFRPVAELPQWVAHDAMRSGYRDVLIYERN